MTHYIRQRNDRIVKEVLTEMDRIKLRINTLLIKLNKLIDDPEQSSGVRLDFIYLNKSLGHLRAASEDTKIRATMTKEVTAADAEKYRKEYQSQKKKKYYQRKLALKKSSSEVIKTNPLEGVDNSLD